MKNVAQIPDRREQQPGGGARLASAWPARGLLLRPRLQEAGGGACLRGPLGKARSAGLLSALACCAP